MNSIYSSKGVTWSGARVPVYTSLATGGDGVPYTATFYYDSIALTSAGYQVVSSPLITTTCPTTQTLAPSPNGSICSPHGDHCQYLDFSIVQSQQLTDARALRSISNLERGT